MEKRYDPFRFLRNFLCGVLIGGGAVLPGVSGGVLAVVFGIYRPFMEILTSPRRGLKDHWRLIPPLGLGGAVGFLTFAWAITLLFSASDTVAVWLFIGLIGGTIPQLFREAGREGRSRGSWVSFGICFAVMFATLFGIGRAEIAAVTPGVGWYVFSGALFGMGVIVPGMTSSAILMALGLYEPVLGAMVGLEIPVLAAIAVGVVVSVLALARTVNWCFRRHYSLAFHGILGVVLASTLVILPVSYTGALEIVLSAVCCAGGYGLARLMDRLDRRVRENE